MKTLTKNARTLFFFLFICFSFFAFSQIPTAGLVAYYPFSGNGNDYSGNFLNGNVQGPQLIPDRFGNPNSAYEFDGINDYISLAASTFTNLNNYTFSAWFKPYGLPSTAVFLYCAGSSTAGECQSVAYLSSGQAFAGSYNIGASPVQSINMSSLTVIPLNQWSHIVVARRTTSLEVYINGVLATSPSSASVGGQVAFYGNGPKAVYLGLRSNMVAGSYLYGALDDVRIYNTALSSSLISQLYNDPGCFAPISFIPSNTPTVCVGSQATIAATGSGTNTLAWFATANSATAITSGSVFSTPTFTQTGNYSYYLGMTSCTAYPRIPVQVFAAPLPTTTVNSGTICAGSTFYVIPGGASSYSFSLGGYTFIPTSTMSYTLNGENLYGCSFVTSGTVTVNPLPVVSIVGPTLVCIGSSATLTGQGANLYNWSTGQTGPSIGLTPTASVTYSVSGQDLNGCVGFAQKSIQAIQSPTISVSGNSVVCQGASVILTANGNAVNYTWTPGGAGSQVILTPTISTNVIVTAADIYGCLTGTNFIVIVQNKPLLIVASSSTAICVGAAVVLTGNGASTFTWSGGVFNNVSFYPTSSNTYTLSGTGLNGCVGFTTQNIIVNQLPVISVSGLSSMACRGETLNLQGQGANFYNWSSGSNSPTINIAPEMTSTYTITGTDNNGCVSRFVFVQNVSECLELEKNTMSQFLLYPQPCENELNLRAGLSNQKLFFQLSDILGRKIATGEFEGSTLLDLSREAPGLYQITITDEFQNSFSQKICKSK